MKRSMATCFYATGRIPVQFLVGVTVLFAAFLATPAPVSARATVTFGRFTSAGRTIDYDWYHAASRKPAPAVLLLHGSAGYGGNRRWVEDCAHTLATRGFHVFAIHYFERTGDVAVASIPTMIARSPAWRETARDAITALTRKPQVDGGRVAVIGLSLGAYLSISIACRDTRVKAVVEFSGGIPHGLPMDIHRMPPVLVLHGDADRIVPVTEAFKLIRWLKSIRCRIESRIYRGEGHMFSRRASADADRCLLRFLGRCLN